MANQVQRMRYFDGLFLTQEEFNLEQDYYLKMRYRHNRHLHTPGIVQGLEVTGFGKKVTVSAGIALNRVHDDGEDISQEIILGLAQEVDLSTYQPGDTVYIYIFLREEAEDIVPSKGGVSEKIHWTERAIVAHSKNPDNINTKNIILAKVVLDNVSGDIKSILYDECIYAGISGKVTETEKLVVKVDGTTSIPWVEGKLFKNAQNIDTGKLEVNSPITDFTGEVTTGGNVKINGNLDVSGTISGKLNYNMVGTGQIVDNAVTAAKIANANVGTTKLADSAVTNAKIAANAVTSDKILDGTIGTAELADNAVTADKIAAASVLTAKLADGTVTDLKLAANAVTTDKIAGLNVTTIKLADSAVTNPKIGPAAVTVDKMAINSVGTNQIIDGAVTNAKLAANAITSDKIADLNVGTAELANGAVTNLKIGPAAVTVDKMAINSVGTNQIVDGAVTNAKLAANAITSDKIADLNVGTAELANGAVTNPKIGAAAVTMDKMALNSVGANQIVDGAVTNAKLAVNSVTSDKIADLNVGTAELANGAVTDLKLAASAVTNAKIAAGAVTLDKLAAAVKPVVSINNVSNPGGNINLLAAANSGLTISPDDASNTITIGQNGFFNYNRCTQTGLSFSFNDADGKIVPLNLGYLARMVLITGGFWVNIDGTRYVPFSSQAINSGGYKMICPNISINKYSASTDPSISGTYTYSLFHANVYIQTVTPKVGEYLTVAIDSIDNQYLNLKFIRKVVDSNYSPLNVSFYIYMGVLVIG